MSSYISARKIIWPVGTEVAINLWKPYVYKFPKSLAWLRLGLCPEMALVSTPLKLVGRFGSFLTTSSMFLCKTLNLLYLYICLS